MSDELKLEPCPNSSCTSKFDPICYHVGGLLQVRCRCGSSGPFKHSEQDAVAAWNTLPRKPKWTTYDGTEETLPPSNSEILFCFARGPVKKKSYAKTYEDREVIVLSMWDTTIKTGDRWLLWPGEE